jgi:hypothetical protein
MSRTAPHSQNQTRIRATPMRVCAYCSSVNHTECCGQLSIGHRAWYCTVTCYHIQRLLMGEPMSQDQLRLLCKIRDEHYPPALLEGQREVATELIRSRTIKPVVDAAIRKEYGDDDE